MSAVRMRHPELPGQDIDVPQSAVPHHRAAGWQVVEDDAPDHAPTASPDESGASTRSRRQARRAPKEA